MLNADKFHEEFEKFRAEWMKNRVNKTANDTKLCQIDFIKFVQQDAIDSVKK